MAKQAPADDKKKGAATPEDAAPKKSKKGLIIIIVGVVLAIAASIGVTLFLLGGKSSGEAAKEDAAPAEPVQQPALYMDLRPPFVVTIKADERQRYLQVHLSVMARDAAVLQLLELHAPLLRNKLISLLSRQDFMALQTDGGKVVLSNDILTAINEVLEKEAPGGAKVEQVLFTNFVMQ